MARTYLLLARTLLQSYAKEENKRFKDFDAEAARVLLDYPWPGNVRELQNVVRNIVVLNDRELVSPDILPPRSTAVVPACWRRSPLRQRPAAVPWWWPMPRSARSGWWKRDHRAGHRQL